jgi:hypothetical protein
MSIPTRPSRLPVAALVVFAMFVFVGPASAVLFARHRTTATPLSSKAATQARITSYRHRHRQTGARITDRRRHHHHHHHHRQTATNTRTSSKRAQVRAHKTHHHVHLPTTPPPSGSGLTNPSSGSAAGSGSNPGSGTPEPAPVTPVSPVAPTDPAAPASPPAEEPGSALGEEPASTPSAIQTGINSGHEPGDFAAAATLGAKLVRVGFPIEDTAAQLRPAIEKYAAEGVRVLPLAEFTGRMPSPTEAQDLASWADAYGPGGTFWAGRSNGNLAIRSIEFGNETDYSGQYHDEPGDASYRLRAETYAVRVKEAAQAIESGGSTVGLLVQADDTSGDWINSMYAAVPELTKYVAGWTMHSYGGREYNEYRFRTLIKQAAEHGASSVPIDVTEWGVTTDNGRCLEYNDGLNPCMTYQEAAQEVRNSFAWMKEMLGSKLVMFIFYQTGDQAPSGVTTNWQGYFGALQYERKASKGPFTEAVEAVLHS